MEVYTSPEAATTVDRVEPSGHRGAGPRSVIEEAKAKVETIDLADLLCGPGQLRRIGEKWTARCPLPDHDERAPSFTVYTDNDRGWYCYGCQRGGDVVNLAALAWDIERADVAAAEVLLAFGHQPPPRPAAWFARQERQRPVRDALEEIKVRHVQRRLFRIFLPAIQCIKEDAERAEEIEAVWDALEEVAVQVVAGRRSA